MRFNPHGKASNPSLERSVNEQNQVCVACHTADKLRENSGRMILMQRKSHVLTVMNFTRKKNR
ncbi:cytochrome c nitrite reductase pentaheme subunit [Actinobacillus equuli]|nr:cytochrome c nitrite reductase pentaheme subunit [Actinobacillus equuli]